MIPQSGVPVRNEIVSILLLDEEGNVVAGLMGKPRTPSREWRLWGAECTITEKIVRSGET